MGQEQQQVFLPLAPTAGLTIAQFGKGRNSPPSLLIFDWLVEIIGALGSDLITRCHSHSRYALFTDNL